MAATGTILRPATASATASAATAALQQRLEQMRTVLRPQAPLPPPQARLVPAATLTATSSPAEIVRWLADEVRRRAGIAVNESVRGKLDKIAAKVPPGELAGWAEKLAASGADHPEWLSLVEMLTVHETYFLRDPGQFAFARRSGLPDIIADQKTKANPALRLWSAACSTGEEAYSLAILALEALEDAGEAEIDAQGRIRLRRRWTIEVLGSDLSRHAVRVAETAVYNNFGLGAFRSLPQSYWRFFEPVKSEGGSAEPARSWRIGDQIRPFVRFRQFNLMNAEAPLRDLDVVFCRNVLIYFDAAGKRHVFKMIHRALKDGRLAVFGPTDIPDPPELFKAQWGTSTVIYRKV